jgi:rhodanese-related sulfurtransferase
MTEKTATDPIAEAKKRIREVTPPEAMEMNEADPAIVYLDVREPMEWNLGRIPGAVFIPLGNLDAQVEATIPREKKIIIYCARGNRSALAADTMQQMGYADVASMSQGIIGWVDAGGEIEE